MTDTIPKPAGPALIYVHTDGTAVQLDLAKPADLATMGRREQVLCRALLDHAQSQMQRAGTYPCAPPAPVSDFEASAPYYSPGVMPL